jgi:hypothetical protein
VLTTVSTGIGPTSGTISLSVLKEDFDKALGILADILTDPAFPQDKIDLAKVQQRTSISRRNDNVGGIASREFSKLIYGKDSPYDATREAQHAFNIGAANGVRRAVALSFEPQYLADSVAAAQIVYDAVMYSSMVHLTNPPAPEVGVRRKMARRGDASVSLSPMAMRGGWMRVTDMAGRAVYEGIIGSQLRKAIGALPVGVYLMTATKDGLVRSSAYAVAR